MDIYTRPINLLVQGTNQYYSTGCGTILTLITYVLVILYAVYQIQLHIENTDYQLNFEVHTDEYDSYDVFNSNEMRFYVAAGIADYSDENYGKIIEDPTYGEIQFFRKNRNVSTAKINWPLLSHKTCEENDFNWGDGRTSDQYSKFLPMASRARGFVKDVGFRLKCL